MPVSTGYGSTRGGTNPGGQTNTHQAYHQVWPWGALQSVSPGKHTACFRLSLTCFLLQFRQQHSDPCLKTQTIKREGSQKLSTDPLVKICSENTSALQTTPISQELGEVSKCCQELACFWWKLPFHETSRRKYQFPFKQLNPKEFLNRNYQNI